MGYRIGIDVGGTNTDAVLLDEDLRVLSAVKTPTTENTGEGVATAVDRVLAAADCDGSQVEHAMLGTTHCTNAIVERKGLGRVGVIRLGAPATTSIPPFEGWPEDLREVVGGHAHVVGGGYEYDGSPLAPLDRDAVVKACENMRGMVDAVAVAGVHSPVNEEQEVEAARIVEDVLGVPVSRSARIGALGLLERENATILNAALIRTLGDMAAGFRTSLEARGIGARIHFGQNDGTLMSLDFALEYPVLTIGCGPTNSIRGAAHLSGVTDALVVDIGGTTTDIGVLIDGFPRQSAHAAEIGGIRTNFRMPDVLSVGLGGGTVVRGSGDDVALGPDSVGYRITEEALVFGGRTTTATDIAAASGRFRLPGTDRPVVDTATLTAAEERIRDLVEDSVDRMKPNAAPMPVVLVGGGSAVAPDDLAGASDVVRPEHFGVANAVGAALGDVAGQVERVYRLTETDRETALADAGAEAVARAVLAGADRDTVEVVSLEELPVAYLSGQAVLVRARAAGVLAR